MGYTWCVSYDTFHASLGDGEQPLRWGTALELTRRFFSRGIATLVVSTATLWGTTRVASASGGVFSPTSSVKHSAMRTVFAIDEQVGRTTAIIEVHYEGAADDFAWLLPVAGTTEVGISSRAVLNRLHDATAPDYRISRRWPPAECPGEVSDLPLLPPPPQAPLTTDAVGARGAVDVLDAGTVGPYDYQVLTVAAEFGGDPARVALDWLAAEGYPVPTSAPEALRAYLLAGMNLVAVRLTQQASAGSIRPIRVTYDGVQPAIPLRLTALSAQENVGVLVWLLGASRAAALNYETLELNEAVIDWFDPEASYREVIGAAANEATGGQGFIVELAEPISAELGNRIVFERLAIDDFRRTADELSPRELLIKLLGDFQTLDKRSFRAPFAAAGSDDAELLDGVADVLAQTLTLPPETTLADLVAAPRCYLPAPESRQNFYCDGRKAPPQAVDLGDFDRLAFLTAVEALVFAPMEEAAQLLRDHVYVTRMRTQLSPDEMTVDPQFGLNPDLGNLARLHARSLHYEGCFGDTTAPWQTDFAGHSMRGRGDRWPLSPPTGPEGMPAALRVVQHASRGTGEVIVDNSAWIATLLDAELADLTGAPDAATDGEAIRPSAAGGCRLQASPPGGYRPGWLGLLGAVPLVGWQRRRSRKAPKTLTSSHVG